MRYTKITIKTNSKQKPHYFMGSTLRGAFGYALKKTVCINPTFKCEGCFSLNSCLFYDFYEKQNDIHPFRFDIELGSSGYDFSYFLFEDACEKLPYILSSFHQMFTKIGIGKDRETIDDISIYVNDILSFNGDEFTIPDDYIKIKQDNIESKSIVLKFSTPLRMKKQKRFIRDHKDLTLIDILLSIDKRAHQLKAKPYERTQFDTNFKVVNTNLKFKDLTRFSNTQKTKMQLGGMMGEMVISNLDEQNLKLLKLGELIGVGKQTVFGLGKIEVIEI